MTIWQFIYVPISASAAIERLAFFVAVAKAVKHGRRFGQLHDEGRVLPRTGMEDVDLLLLSQRRDRDQLLVEIWGGETAEQNVPEKIDGEPEEQ